MKKNIIFLAALALLALMPTGLKAQTEYITDVMVIGAYSSSDVSSMASTYQAQGWTRIDYDLNKGCGISSHDIYLLYKTGTDVAEAITDFYLWVGDSNTSEDSFTLNGRTYTRSACDGDDEFKSSKGDLNKKAEGDYIFVYYTKDNTNFAPARAVTGISVDNNSSYAVGMNGTSTPCDLNKGAGGDLIYLHTPKTVTSSTPFDVSTEALLKDVITLSNINIRLTGDITLSSTLVIPNSITATIDLNDHKLSRSLSSSEANGQVLQVNSGGTLTLTDGGSRKKGCVTGGWATNNGGGVWVQGNFIFQGGTISGNKAEWGGGIFIKPEGTVTMTGGTIKENTVSKNGGGIYIQGTLNMNGSPIVERNAMGNVYMSAGKVVTVTGAFSEGAHAGITTANGDAVITSGYGTHNPSAAAKDFLFSDNGFSFSLDGGEVKQKAPTGNWADFRSETFSNASSEIRIMNEAELALLAYNVNQGNDYAGVTFLLDRDLDMGSHEWTAIGNHDHPFRGNFDGQGHTISGIWFSPDNTGDYHGLFGCIEGKLQRIMDDFNGSDYIKNFVLTNSNVTGGNYVGGVAGFISLQVVVQNIVCQANVKGTEHVGGVVGRAEGLINGEWYIGALFDVESWITIEDCLQVDGGITGTSNIGAVVGSTGKFTNFWRNYYLNPISATGNSNEVRAYPIAPKNLPTGVAIDYASDGVSYKNLRYAPAGTVNIKVNNTDITNHVRSVKVNGTEVGTSTGSYSFNLDPDTDNEITVETEATSSMTGDGTLASPYQIMTTEH